jgi:hypothetical protein
LRREEGGGRKREGGRERERQNRDFGRRDRERERERERERGPPSTLQDSMAKMGGERFGERW